MSERWRWTLRREVYMMGAKEAAKTHCPRGHPYDAKNTRINPSGSRECRQCGNEQYARTKARGGVAFENLKAMHRRSAKRQYAQMRKKVLDAYGHTCACCGETVEAFLCIDHIAGGGGKHRRSLGISGGSSQNFYRWLINENFPEGFQTLCHNCNFAKHTQGLCPHKGGDAK